MEAASLNLSLNTLPAANRRCLFFLSTFTMQAARLAEGSVVVQTVPIPEPKDGEARLKIIQGGVCNTDVELTRG